MNEFLDWTLMHYEKAMQNPVTLKDEHCEEFECPEGTVKQQCDLSTYTTYPACMGPDYLFAIGATEIEYIYSMGKMKQQANSDNVLYVKYHGYTGIYKMMLPALMEWTDKEILKMIGPAVRIFFSHFKHRGKESHISRWIQGGCQGQLKGTMGNSKIWGTRKTLAVIHFANPEQMKFANKDIVECIEKNRDIIKMHGIALPNMVIQTNKEEFRFIFKASNPIAELANIFRTSFATDTHIIGDLRKILHTTHVPSLPPEKKNRLDDMKKMFDADGKWIREQMNALPPL